MHEPLTILTNEHVNSPSPAPEPDDATLPALAAALVERIAGYGPCAVALSGGVDSAVAAQAAYLAWGEQALAVTGVSPSLAAGELDVARQVAAAIGIRHRELPTQEMERDGYRQNAPDRCYHCKTELYTRLEELGRLAGFAVIVNGANLDDRGDYRPGMQAAAEHAVRSPLLEGGLGKRHVRALAAYWGLPVWDKPANPCLSSRIAYGQQVTPERLAMIDQAEQFLRSLGFGELRVRYHGGDLARLELPAEALVRLADAAFREQVTARLRSLGFQYVTLDLEGFRSGSLNQVLPLESLLARPKQPEGEGRR